MKKIVSYIFIFLLSIPILVGLGHFVIDERHEICSDFTTHFHEKELDCFSCEYNRNQIEYTRTTFYFDEIIKSFNNEPSKSYNSTLQSQFILSYDLRGPPFKSILDISSV